MITNDIKWQAEKLVEEERVKYARGNDGNGSKPQSGSSHSFRLNDIGNSERLVEEYGDILRYSYERRKWLIWDGRCWEPDAGDRIVELTKGVIKELFREAIEEADDNMRKLLTGHASKSASQGRINALITLAQSCNGVPVCDDELDRHPFLLNCSNGTIDLRSGDLLAHDKSNLITKIIPVKYDHNARCPRWNDFINQITNGDSALGKYLQRAVGYSLTGDVGEQCFFFLYGTGSNGKSTFVNTIRKLLGDFAISANIDTFMAKDSRVGSGPTEGLANLKGKRFVTASELEEGQRLSVNLVKSLTGGENIRANRKYEHEIEFAPTHKIWLSGNHKPRISDTTLSIWRRVKLIPFVFTVQDSACDPYLPQKLSTELPGILAWAVEGCLQWQASGLQEPESVLVATSDYQRDQDLLSDFLSDCCLLGQGLSVAKSQLRTEYENWCQCNSIDPIKQTTFKSLLSEKGVKDWKGTGGIRLWKNIGLKVKDDGI